MAQTIWVNGSYIKAVEAADVDTVIANKIEIVDDSRIESPATWPISEPQGPQPCGDRRRQMRPRRP